MKSSDRPATFNHLARQFGATAPLVASVARLLVAQGHAVGSYAEIHGQRKMFGLLPIAPTVSGIPT